MVPPTITLISLRRALGCSSALSLGSRPLAEFLSALPSPTNCYSFPCLKRASIFASNHSIQRCHAHGPNGSNNTYPLSACSDHFLTCPATWVLSHHLLAWGPAWAGCSVEWSWSSFWKEILTSYLPFCHSSDFLPPSGRGLSYLSLFFDLPTRAIMASSEFIYLVTLYSMFVIIFRLFL